MVETGERLKVGKWDTWAVPDKGCESRLRLGDSESTQGQLRQLHSSSHRAASSLVQDSFS